MGANFSTDLKPLTAKLNEILALAESIRKEIGRLSGNVGALQQEVAALKARREPQSGKTEPRGAQQAPQRRN